MGEMRRAINPPVSKRAVGANFDRGDGQYQTVATSADAHDVTSPGKSIRAELHLADLARLVESGFLGRAGMRRFPYFGVGETVLPGLTVFE